MTSGAIEGSHWLQTMLAKAPEAGGNHNILVMFAHGYNRLGIILYRQQLWAQASQAYLTARTFADKAGIRSISISTKLNEGLILTEQGFLDSARPLLEDAEEYYRLEGQTDNWVTTLLNLGRLELREGNLGKAEALLLEGIKSSIEKSDLSFVCCNLNLISCALLQGKDSEPYIVELKKLEPILDINNRAAFYYFVGLAAYSIGNAKLERKYSARAQDLIAQGASVNSFDLNLRSRVVMK